MQYSKNKELQVSALTKIYVWSVLFEPLLYFVILPQNITGIGANISRLFQLIVIFSLFFKVLLTMKIKFSSPFSSLNNTFAYYYIYIILIGIIGYLVGSYSYFQIEQVANDENFFSLFVNSYHFRPFFEYFIALYYFVYFVVLAQYMLTKKEAIDYFFKWFNLLFLICIFVGFIDLLLVVLFNPEYYGLSRHIADTQYPGNRFHGIAGEPRDAFVYLILCIGILTIRDIWEDKKKLTLFWILLILIATFLTQSFSGVLGLIFTIGLLLVFFIRKLTFKKQVLLLIVFLITILFVYLNVMYSIRMLKYYDAISLAYFNLSNGLELESVLIASRNNIFPVWALWLEVQEFNFFHLFFGNGLGSSSVINNFYFNYSGVINPNASIVRMLYETGIIGIFLFIFIFISPLKKLSIDYKIYTKLKLLMLIMLGLYFSHRNPAPYIFFGIILAVFHYKLIGKNSNSKNEI